MEKVRIAVVYYSKYGHTKLLAEAVLRGITESGAAEGVLFTADEATAAMEELDSFDAIVFGSATYMGNIAADFKKFMEKSVIKWFGRSWSGKIAGGFTNSSNFAGDKGNTLMGLVTYAMQMGMIWVGVDDIASENQPQEMNHLTGPGVEALNRVSASLGVMSASFQVKAPDAPGEGDLHTARNYGNRIAKITAQFKRGEEMAHHV